MTNIFLPLKMQGMGMEWPFHSTKDKNKFEIHNENLV